MLSTDDVAKVLDTILSIPGMNETVKIDLKITRKNALLLNRQEHHFENPICAFSYDIMRLAKISGSATYHKVIKDLNDFGYIKYEPSFKRNKRSQIYIPQ